MTERFTARVLFAGILEELDTTLITLADAAAAPTRTLELQKALQADEEDPDSDTYCVIIDGAATHYGGVIRCQLTREQLRLKFSDQAAAVFGTDSLEVALDLSNTDWALLRSELLHLFAGDRNAPGDLALDQTI